MARQPNWLARSAGPRGLGLSVLGALLAVLILLARPTEASHLCGDTGSSAGPFNIVAYEAKDWQTVYGRTLELAGFNQLFPDVASFKAPALERGPRASASSDRRDPYVPPVLLKAIGWIESSWTQADATVPYGGVGPALVSHDCGYGIMQITTGMQNTSGVPSLDQAMIGGHYAFNVARGGQILIDKWNAAPEVRPLVGERDPAFLESWYYAVWGYNGFAFQNHPLNPRYPAWPRTPYSCGPIGDGFGHDRSQYPYQELAFGCATHPPQPGGALLWNPVEGHLPNLSDPAFAGPLSLANWQPCSVNLDCAPMDIPLPNPANTDPTTSIGDRSQAIGSPSVGISPANVTLETIPAAESLGASITISNPGTGPLVWRLSKSVPWLRLSRIQGVSLGTDIGPKGQTFTVVADGRSLLPGSHSGRIIVETLYGAGGFSNIQVTLRVLDFPDGTLVRGSSAPVYVLRGGLKRWIPNPATFEANGFAWSSIRSVPNSWLKTIPTGEPLLDALADGNLLRGSDAAVYVMEAGAKRHVPNPQVFADCGYGWDAVKTISNAALNSIPSASPVSGPPCPQLAFAEGTLLRGSGPAAYVVADGGKHWLIDPSVFLGCGYQWGNVNPIAGSTLSSLAEGAQVTMCIPTGTLIRGSGPQVYIVRSGLKRWVPNPATFEANGFSWNGIVSVPDSWLQTIPTGQPLLDALANGTLLKGSGAAVYAMEAGSKRHIPDPQVFSTCGYGWDAVLTVSDAVLSSIPTGSPLSTTSCPLPSFAEGTLLQGQEPAVYVVVGGKRRWLADPDVFLSCGFRWGNINRVAESVLTRLAQGAKLTTPPCR